MVLMMLSESLVGLDDVDGTVCSGSRSRAMVGMSGAGSAQQTQTGTHRNKRLMNVTPPTLDVHHQHYIALSTEHQLKLRSETCSAATSAATAILVVPYCLCPDYSPID